MSTKQQIFATCIKMEKNLKFLWAGKNFSVKNKRKKRSKVFRIKKTKRTCSSICVFIALIRKQTKYYS